MAGNFKCLNRLKYLYTYRDVSFAFKSTLARKGKKSWLNSKDVIEFNELQQQFGRMKSFTGPEIENMKKSLIGKVYFNQMSNRWLEVEANSVSLFVLQCCDRFDATNVGFQYFKYLIDSGEKITLNEQKLLFNLVQKDKTLCYENQEFLYEQYSQLSSSLELMDHFTLKSCISLLCSLNNHWKEGIDLIKKKGTDFTVKMDEYYGTIAAAAFRYDEPEVGWELLESCKKEVEISSLIAYMEHLEKLVMKSSFSVEKLNQLFNFMQRKQIHLRKTDIDFFKKLKNLVHLLNSHYEIDYLWKISQSIADRETGHCPSCDKDLNKTAIDSKSFVELRLAYFNDALIGKDINIKSSHAEAKRFYKYLCSSPHFDVVLDGLNIGYKGNNVVERVAFLKHFITHFQSKNQNVLLLGRYHMVNWSKFQEIQKLCSVFLFDNSTDDDAYLIYAAMFKGINTCICTGDFLRGKTNFFVNQELTETFELWQKTHQYGIFVKGSTKIVIPPIKHAVVTHQIHPTEEAVDSGEMNWHIACAPNEFNITGYNFEATLHWICLQRLLRENAKVESVKNRISSPKSSGEPFFVEEEMEKPIDIPSKLLQGHKMKFSANSNQKLSDSELSFTEVGVDFKRNSFNAEIVSGVSTESDAGNSNLWNTVSCDDLNDLKRTPIKWNKSKKDSNKLKKPSDVQADTNIEQSDIFENSSESGINHLKFSNNNEGSFNKPEDMFGISNEIDRGNSVFLKNYSSSNTNSLLDPVSNPDVSTSKAVSSKIARKKRSSSYSGEILHFRANVDESQSDAIFRKIDDQELVADEFQLSSMSYSRVPNEFLSEKKSIFDPKEEEFEYPSRKASVGKINQNEGEFGLNSEKKLHKTRFTELKFRRKERNAVAAPSNSIFHIVSNFDENFEEILEKNEEKGREIHNIPRNFEFDESFDSQRQMKIQKGTETSEGWKSATDDLKYSSKRGRNILNNESYEKRKESIPEPETIFRNENIFEAPQNVERVNVKPKTFFSPFGKSCADKNMEKKHSFADKETKPASMGISDGTVGGRNIFNNESYKKRKESIPELETIFRNENIFEAPQNIERINVKPETFISAFGKSCTDENMEKKHSFADKETKPTAIGISDGTDQTLEDVMKSSDRFTEPSSNEIKKFELTEELLFKFPKEDFVAAEENGLKPKRFTSFQKSFQHVKNQPASAFNLPAVKEIPENIIKERLKMPERRETAEEKSSDLKSFARKCSDYLETEKKTFNDEEKKSIAQKAAYEPGQIVGRGNNTQTSNTFTSSFKKSYKIENIKKDDLNSDRKKLKNGTVGEKSATSLKNVNLQFVRHLSSFKKSYIVKNVAYTEKNSAVGSVDVSTPKALIWTPDAWTSDAELNPDPLQTSKNLISDSQDLVDESENDMPKYTVEDDTYFVKNLDRILTQCEEREKKINAALENPNPNLISDTSYWDLQHLNTGRSRLYKTALEILDKTSAKITEEKINEERLVTSNSNADKISDANVAESGQGVVTESSSISEDPVLNEILQYTSAKIQNRSVKNSQDVVKKDAKFTSETSKEKFVNAREEKFNVYDRLLPEIFEKYSKKKKLDELEKRKIKSKFESGFIKSLIEIGENVNYKSENVTDKNIQKMKISQKDLFQAVMQNLDTAKLKEIPGTKPENQNHDTSLKSNTEANQISSKDEVVKKWYNVMTDVIAKMYVNSYLEKGKSRSFQSSFQKFIAIKETEMKLDKETGRDHESVLYSDIIDALQRSSEKIEKRKSLTATEDPLYRMICESLFKQIARIAEEELKDQKSQEYIMSQNFIHDPLEVEEKQSKKMEAALRIIISQSSEENQKQKALEDSQLNEKVLNFADSYLNNNLKTNDELYERLIPTGGKGTEANYSQPFSFKSEEQYSLDRELIENDLKIGFSKSEDLYSTLQYSLAKTLKRYEEEMELERIEERISAAADKLLGVDNELFFKYLKKMVDEEFSNDENATKQLISNSEKLKEFENYDNFDPLNDKNCQFPENDMHADKRNLNENMEQKLMEDSSSNEFLKSEQMSSDLQGTLAKPSNRYENEIDSRNSPQQKDPDSISNLNADQSLEKSNEVSTESLRKKSEIYIDLNVLNDEILKSKDLNYNTAEVLTETELLKSNEMYSILQTSLAKSSERQNSEIISKNSAAIDSNSTDSNLIDDGSSQISNKTSPETSEEERANDELIYEQLIASSGKTKKSEELINLNVLHHENFETKDEKLFRSNYYALENDQVINENVGKKPAENGLEAEPLQLNEIYSLLQNSLAMSCKQKHNSSLEGSTSNYWESFCPSYEVLENEPSVNENVNSKGNENDLEIEFSNSSKMYSALVSSLSRSSERMEKEMTSKKSAVENIDAGTASLNVNGGHSSDPNNRISLDTSEAVIDKELAENLYDRLILAGEKVRIPKKSVDEYLYDKLILAGEKLRSTKESAHSKSNIFLNLRNLLLTKVENSSTNKPSEKMGDSLLESKEDAFDTTQEMVSKLSKEKTKETSKPCGNVPLNLNLNAGSIKETNELTYEENFKSEDKVSDAILLVSPETDQDMVMVSDLVESVSPQANLDSKAEEKEYSTNFETEESLEGLECSLEKSLPQTDALLEIPLADRADFLKLYWGLPDEQIDRILSRFLTRPSNSKTNWSDIFLVPLPLSNNDVSNSVSDKKLKEIHDFSFLSNENKTNSDCNASKLFFETDADKKSDFETDALFSGDVKFSNNDFDLPKDLYELLSYKEGHKIRSEENLIIECYESSHSQTIGLNYIFLPKVSIRSIEFSESNSQDNNMKNEIKIPKLKLKGRNSNLSVEFQSAFKYSRKFAELYPWWQFPKFKHIRKYGRTFPGLYSKSRNGSADFETKSEMEIDPEINDGKGFLHNDRLIADNYLDDLDNNSGPLDELIDFTEFYSTEDNSANEINKAVNGKLNRGDAEMENFAFSEKKIKFSTRAFLDSMETCK